MLILNVFINCLICTFCLLCTVKCNVTMRTVKTEQDIQKILQSIDERLQIIEKIERKVDNLNTRINRLENSVDVKIEKFGVDINMNYEHTLRKIDTTHDRYSHRINYIETKFDKELKKLENKIDLNTKTLDRIENNFGSRQEFIETEIIENTEGLKEIQISMDNFHEELKMNENRTHNEILTGVEQLETIIKENNQIINTTKHETLQEQLRSTAIVQRLANDVGSVLKSINGVGAMVQKKFAYFNQKMDSNFNNTQLAHNLFLESCHRLQLDEPQLEAKIVYVMEALLNLVTNKTVNMYGEIHYLQDLLRSHDSAIKNRVSLAKNTSLEMAQKSFAYKQEILNTILDMKSNLNQWFLQTGDILNNNRTDNLEKLGAIEKGLLKVQQHILNINSTQKENIDVDGITDKLIKFIQGNLLENVITQHHQVHKQKIEKLEKYIENIHDILTQIHVKLNNSTVAENQCKNLPLISPSSELEQTTESDQTLRSSRSIFNQQKSTNASKTHESTIESVLFKINFQNISGGIPAPVPTGINGTLNSLNETTNPPIDTEFNYSTDFTEDENDDTDFTY